VNGRGFGPALPPRERLYCGLMSLQSQSAPIVGAAAMIVDDAGRILRVRTRGTSVVMQAGGDPASPTGLRPAPRTVQHGLPLAAHGCTPEDLTPHPW
jgi:hypothetical protein